MKKQIISLLLSVLWMVSISTFSQQVSNRQFTVVKKNAITSVKNQNRSGTCWCFATLGFIESELLRKTGKTYDLCEMFVVNHDYMDNATHYVRMHGLSELTEGGSADDVFDVIRTHGICPETAMPSPGSLVGDTLANFTEFVPTLHAKVKQQLVEGQKHPNEGWQNEVQTVIDRYVGKCPETFMYEGKSYTPQSFASSLEIDWTNYISLTSFTHHPFYENFVIEAPYKWRLKPSYNLPIEELMSALDHALLNGYCVAWGGDVSGDFTRYGIAELPEGVVPNQALRQEQFDNWTFTYDHVMLIYGIAKDENGHKYYMVKNSWGKMGYDGTWYMSEDYIKLNTTYIYVCKDAVDGVVKF